MCTCIYAHIHTLHLNIYMYIQNSHWCIFSVCKCIYIYRHALCDIFLSLYTHRHGHTLRWFLTENVRFHSLCYLSPFFENGALLMLLPCEGKFSCNVQMGSHANDIIKEAKRDFSQREKKRSHEDRARSEVAIIPKEPNHQKRERQDWTFL